MPRRRKPAPSLVRTAQQLAREQLLRAQGYRKVDVYRALPASSGLSLTAVRAVLDNRYRNEDVIAAFCRLTGVAADVAFPPDEPPYKTSSKRVARTSRAQRVDANGHERGSAARAELLASPALDREGPAE